MQSKVHIAGALAAALIELMSPLSAVARSPFLYQIKACQSVVDKDRTCVLSDGTSTIVVPKGWTRGPNRSPLLDALTSGHMDVFNGPNDGRLVYLRAEPTFGSQWPNTR